MERRKFLATVAAATCTASLNWSQIAQAGDPHPANRVTDGRGRMFLAPPKQILFTDLRHIESGDLGWIGPDGKGVPTARVPKTPVPVTPDNSGIAMGIRFVAQKANKEGPIANMPTGIVHDGGLYRAWSIRVNYQGDDLGSYSDAPAKSIVLNYSESQDGYDWKRRPLNEISVSGIRSGISGIDGEGFFIDPVAPPEERYKAIFHAGILGDVSDLWEKYGKIHPLNRDIRVASGHVSCLFGLVSPDGLNWNLLPEPLMVHIGDTDNIVYYDAWLEKYVLYTRYLRYDRRVIARAESKDFRHWDPVQPIVAIDLGSPCSYDVYTNAKTIYPGLPEQHLLFPTIYRRDTQTSEIHVYSSIDGLLWDRVPGGPVLEPSNPPGWDGLYVLASRNLVPLGHDRIAISYGGYKRPHKYPRWPTEFVRQNGWAWWQKGRLVGLVADEVGQFNTFALPVAGKKLTVNARVRPGGEIRIGVNGREGRKPADCDPITGDNLAHALTWHGDAAIGVDVGQTVSLRVEMKAAELFGLEWV